MFGVLATGFAVLLGFVVFLAFESYGRSVVDEEWPRMEDGTEGDTLNPWASAMFRTLKTTEPVTAAEQAAYQKWLDQTSDRELGHSDRMRGAQGVLPGPLWAVLFFSAGVVLVFMLFFADRGEHLVVQAVLIGSVVAVLCTTLLVIGELESPYHSGAGSPQPVAMKRTLVVLEEELTVAGGGVPVLCDAQGAPL